MNQTHANNNFGALRLFFAFLVIFSHSPQMIDGNSSRELLHSITGTITFGELAVDCFFLISGYLIINSYQNSPSFLNYLKKRVLRIYPGFIVASIICIVVFVPLSAGWNLINWPVKEWIKNSIKSLFLFQPIVQGVFKGNHHALLNGSMWTIQYEFICYLLAPVFALIALQRKALFLITILIFSITFILLNHYNVYYELPAPFYIIVIQFFRLTTAFMVGAAYFLYGKNIVWNTKISVLSLIALLISLAFPLSAELGLFVFGGYLLFNFALNYKQKYLNRIGTKNDISYGVYLYAWPFQNLIIQNNPAINPWILTLLTIIFVSMMGYLSWVFVERPFTKLKSPFSKLKLT